MKWLAVALLSFTNGQSPEADKQPGLVIVCARGGVLPMGRGAVAIGETCVLHDGAGRATTVESLGAYDQTLAVP